MSLLFVLTASAGPRLEIPLQGVADLDVVPAPTGVAVFQQDRGDRRTYTITGYDLGLTERWTTTWAPDRPHHEQSRDSDEHFAWLLATRGDDARALRVSLADGAIADTPVLPLTQSFAQTIVSDGAGGAWVSGSRRKRGTLTYITPTATSYGVDTGHRGPVVGLSHPVRRPGVVQAVVHERSARLGSPLTVLDLEGGEVTRSVLVQPYDRHLLLTGRTLTVGDRTFAAGTWSATGLTSATGLYVARIQDGAQTTYSATAFADLDNPLAHLNERRERRATARLRRSQRGGRARHLRWDLLVHEPVATPDGFLLVAEAYYPVFTSRTVTEMLPDARGTLRPHQRTVTEFAGYSFSHALVVGYDLDGNRRFDHSLRLLTGLSPTLRTNVHVTGTETGAMLLYPADRDLRRALVVGDQLVVEDVRSLTDDMGPRTTSSGALWWHDDRFLLYGVDRRTDRERGEPRRVFFLSEMEAPR